MSDASLDYRNLIVWQRAHAMTVALDGETRAMPSEERFGLTSQMRRAAVSIGSNIAEGRSRLTPRAYASFLDIASGSAGEVSYLLLLATDLGYLEDSACVPLSAATDEIRKMLGGLHRSVQTRIRR